MSDYLPWLHGDEHPPLSEDDFAPPTKAALEKLDFEYSQLPVERIAYLNAGFPELWEDIERAQRAGRYFH